LDKQIIFSRITNRIHYLDDNKKRVRLRPSEVHEIQINYNGEEFRLLSRRINIPGDRSVHRFLVLEKDGYVKKLRHYFDQDCLPTNNNIRQNWWQTVVYLQKGDAPLQRIRRGMNKLKADVLELLGDNPKTVEIINRENFRRENLAALIEDYNQNR